MKPKKKIENKIYPVHNCQTCAYHCGCPFLTAGNMYYNAAKEKGIFEACPYLRKSFNRVKNQQSLNRTDIQRLPDDFRKDLEYRFSESSADGQRINWN